MKRSILVCVLTLLVWIGSLSSPAFAQAPGQVTASAPTGVSGRTPAFVWHALSGVEGYVVQVVERTRTSSNWVTAAAAGCGSGTGTCSATFGHDLDVGFATWSVIAANSNGYGPWSTAQPIVVDVADAAAPQATAQAPSGTIYTAWPSFQWPRVASAVWYRFSLRDGANIEVDRWVLPQNAGCVTESLCELWIDEHVSAGAGDWKVQAWTTSGHGAWSTSQAFVAGYTAPAPPRAQTPQTTITDQTPTFTWAASTGATGYVLSVYNGESLVTFTYTAAEAGCAADVSCEATPDQVLAAGPKNWNVSAQNSQGQSDWSQLAFFRVATASPAQVNLDTPVAGGLTVRLPRFRWNASSDATRYLLQITDSTSTTHNLWYTAAEAGCAIGEFLCRVSPGGLPDGPGSWSVMASNTIADGPSSATRTFVACAGETTPDMIGAPASGQSGTITVDVDAACGPWTATSDVSSNASWLQVTGGTSGYGDGSVTYTVDANPTAAIRSAVLTFGGAVNIPVSQAPTCSYTVGPTSLVFPVGGETRSVSVTAPAGCAWTATSTVAWLTIASGASGTGNGLVEYVASANPDASMRTGGFVVAGGNYIAYQAGTTADTTLPIITTQIFPSATPEGWHNTDVTITFFCHDTSAIAECPAPIVVTQEGVNQVFSRTATDVGSSRVDLQACKLEYSIVSPK